MRSEGRELLTLATVRQLKHDTPAAEELARQAIGKMERGTEEHVDATSFLGKLLQSQNRGAEAEEQFSRAHAIQNESIGPAATETLASLTRIAYAQQLQGLEGSEEKMSAAEENYLQAIDGLEIAAGWSDGNTNLAADSLRKLYLLAGRLEEAQNLTERVGEGLSGAFGEKDPKTLMNQTQLANIMIQRNQKADACAVLEVILEEMNPGLPAFRAAFQQHQELLDDLERE